MKLFDKASVTLGRLYFINIKFYTMKKIFTLAILIVFVFSSVHASGHKRVLGATKATIHEVGGIFVLVPEKYKDHKLIPLGLPAEYKMEGLPVVVEGAISRCKNKSINIAIYAIAVDQDSQKKFALQHIEYNNKLYSLSSIRF